MKRILTILLVLIIAYFSYSQAFNNLDRNNSTSTNLGANATFTGVVKDLFKSSNPEYSSISIFISANQNSAANGFIVYFSPDSTIWLDSLRYTVLANINQTIAFNIKARFYKIKYVNGATPTTSFYISSIISRYPVAQSAGLVDNDTSIVSALNNLAASTNLISRRDTSKTTVDSLVFGFTSKGISVINDATVTDTLFVSPGSGFTSTQIITTPGQESFFYRLGWTKLYYKMGTVPTSGKKFRIRVY